MGTPAAPRGAPRVPGQAPPSRRPRSVAARTPPRCRSRAPPASADPRCPAGGAALTSVGAAQSRVGLPELRHPVALHREAVTDERQPHDLPVRDLGDEVVGGVRVAHLILLPLQGDPRLLEGRGRLKHQLVLRVRRVVQACSRAQVRAGEILLGAEPEAQALRRRCRAGTAPGSRTPPLRRRNSRPAPARDSRSGRVCFCTWWLSDLEVRGDHLAGRVRRVPPPCAGWRSTARMSTPMTTAPRSASACAMLMTPSSQPPSPERKIATLLGCALRDGRRSPCRSARPADARPRGCRPAGAAGWAAGLCGGRAGRWRGIAAPPAAA